MRPLRTAKLDELARQRVALARRRVVELTVRARTGLASRDELFAAYRQVAFAARDSALRDETVRKTLLEYRDQAKQVLEDERALVAAPTSKGQFSVDEAEAALAEAEYWLAEVSQ